MHPVAVRHDQLGFGVIQSFAGSRYGRERHARIIFALHGNQVVPDPDRVLSQLDTRALGRRSTNGKAAIHA